MAYKSILAVITQESDVDATIAAVLPIISANGAHLDVLCVGVDHTQTGYIAAGGIAYVSQETQEFALEAAHGIEVAVKARLAGETISWASETTLAQIGALTTIVAHRAKFSDLVILPRPYGKTASEDAPVVLEAALFEGHAPVMVVPVGLTPELPFKHIVVAWNQSAEALAAIRAALPLLVPAESVDIAIIDPARHGVGTTDPGAELAMMLSRHGARAKVSVLAQTLHRVADEIRQHVTDVGGDLLVMGAYGHSRFREAILGGATRDMLENSEVPVLLAR